MWGEPFGEKVSGSPQGEEVVRGTLLILINYLFTLFYFSFYLNNTS